MYSKKRSAPSSDPSGTPLNTRRSDAVPFYFDLLFAILGVVFDDTQQFPSETAVFQFVNEDRVVNFIEGFGKIQVQSFDVVVSSFVGVDSAEVHK